MKNGKSPDLQGVKEKIYKLIKERREITVEQAIELVRPFFVFDPEKAYNAELRRMVQRIISGFKDDNGVRKCFSDNNGHYIFIDKTNDGVAVKRVRRQLQRKYDGTSRSLKKVVRREETIKKGKKSSGRKKG